MTAHGGTVRALFWVLVFQGVSAVAGGAMLLAGGELRDESFPTEWLDATPFATWFWPGIILGVGLGVSAFALAYGLARRPAWGPLAVLSRATGHHWSWVGSIGLGTGLMAWIVTQLFLIPGTTWLQPLYFAVGAAIVALALTRGVRHRVSQPAAPPDLRH
jgi:hypothetical protein